MCASVIIDGKEYETIRQLCDRLGSLVPERYRPIVNVDVCLCPIDIPATARLHGYTAARDERGDWVLSR